MYVYSSSVFSLSVVADYLLPLLLLYTLTTNTVFLTQHFIIVPSALDTACGCSAPGDTRAITGVRFWSLFHPKKTKRFPAGDHNLSIQQYTDGKQKPTGNSGK